MVNEVGIQDDWGSSNQAEHFRIETTLPEFQAEFVGIHKRRENHKRLGGGADLS